MHIFHAALAKERMKSIRAAAFIFYGLYLIFYEIIHTAVHNEEEASTEPFSQLKAVIYFTGSLYITLN